MLNALRRCLLRRSPLVDGGWARAASHPKRSAKPIQVCSGKVRKVTSSCSRHVTCINVQDRPISDDRTNFVTTEE